MATCPACKGTRIRDDYKPAPLLLRLFGLRALLCDYCNHQFRAFSPLPLKSRKPRSLQRKADVFNEVAAIDLHQLGRLDRTDPPASPVIPPLPQAAAKLPPVELGIDSMGEEPAPPLAPPVPDLAVAASHLSPAHAGSHAIDPLDVDAPQHDLKAEIAKLHTQREAQPAPEAMVKTMVELPDTARPAPLCPECHSHDVRRRHRTAIERAALSLTNHRAYLCRGCNASFYAKPDPATSASNLADA